MNRERLLQLLDEVRAGQLTPDEAAEALRRLPFADLGHSKVDLHRELRTGAPEIVLAQYKTPEQVVEIVVTLAAAGQNVLVTRLGSEAAARLVARYPEGRYSAVARTFVLETRPGAPPAGCVAVLSAGTSDEPVAEEAAVTAAALGAQVDRIYDVGVAGLHRLLAHMPRLLRAHALVVVAGMEGALPSVVAGLVEAPVIAVPTSVGYGAHLGGIAPLLTMLNSCASGVTVVNIDNGFGAGYTAALINRLAARGQAPDAEPPAG